MPKKKQEESVCPMFIGSTSLGERGQVVIPKEVREIYNLQKGDRLAVVSHKEAIALIPMDQAEAMLKHLTKQLDAIVKTK